MTMTRDGYRYAPCVVCRVATEMGIRDEVQEGRCYIRGVGDVCSRHYHLLAEALTDDGGISS